MKKMMEDTGRNIPDEPCYTPYDLKDLFSRACLEVLNNNDSFCYYAWDAFSNGFRYMDPNSVTEDNYGLYFDVVLPVISQPNTALYWSGVPSVVAEISKNGNISSSANQFSSEIINIMTEQFNVRCWCGNETAVIDTVNPCPVEPTVMFWKAFSYYFGKSGRGIVFWIGDGSIKGGAYQDSSLFTTTEFPQLTYPRVIRLVAIDIYECNEKKGEECGVGTLKLLEEQAVQKYGSKGYECHNVCGNALDAQEVPILAKKALQIIRQHGGMYFNKL